MRLTRLTTGSLLDAPFDARRNNVFIGRLVVFLTALLLAVMPFTEYLWTWDHFLQGGADLEFSLLGIAATLGIICILSLHTERSITSLMTALRVISLVLQRVLGLFSCSTSKLLIWVFPFKEIPDPGLALYNIPLQI